MNKFLLMAFVCIASFSGVWGYESFSRDSKENCLILANLEALSESENGAALVSDHTTKYQNPDTGQIEESTYRICVGVGDLEC